MTLVKSIKSRLSFMKREKKYKLFYFLIALSIISQVNNTLAQPIPTAVSNLLPKGYEVLNSAVGDLNLDAYPDLIIVLNKANEAKTSEVSSHPEKRPLLIFTGGPGHSYRLEGRNDKAVYCVDCGGMMGDPFTGITIKKGYFSVEHYGGSGWRWTRVITFKYSTKDKIWLLYKDGHESFHVSDPENVKEKVYTAKNFGRIPFASFDIYKE